MQFKTNTILTLYAFFLGLIFLIARNNIADIFGWAESIVLGIFVIGGWSIIFTINSYWLKLGLRIFYMFFVLVVLCSDTNNIFYIVIIPLVVTALYLFFFWMIKSKNRRASGIAISLYFFQIISGVSIVLIGGRNILRGNLSIAELGLYMVGFGILMLFSVICKLRFLPKSESFSQILQFIWAMIGIGSIYFVLYMLNRNVDGFGLLAVFYIFFIFVFPFCALCLFTLSSKVPCFMILGPSDIAGMNQDIAEQTSKNKSILLWVNKSLKKIGSLVVVKFSNWSKLLLLVKKIAYVVVVGLIFMAGLYAVKNDYHFPKKRKTNILLEKMISNEIQNLKLNGNIVQGEVISDRKDFWGNSIVISLPKLRPYTNKESYWRGDRVGWSYGVIEVYSLGADGVSNTSDDMRIKKAVRCGIQTIDDVKTFSSCMEELVTKELEVYRSLNQLLTDELGKFSDKDQISMGEYITDIKDRWGNYMTIKYNVSPQIQKLLKKVRSSHKKKKKYFATIVARSAGVDGKMKTSDDLYVEERLQFYKKIKENVYDLKGDICDNPTDSQYLTLKALAEHYRYNVNDCERYYKLRSVKILNLKSSTGEKIKDLSPLKDLVNLTVLYIREAEIHSLNDLKSLAKLTKLDVEASKLSDISALKSMVGLKKLRIVGETNIADLSPLENLTELEDVKIESEWLHDFSALKNLGKLKRFDLSGTGITSLRSLGSLDQLDELKIESTPLIDLSGIEKLDNLKLLKLNQNNIADISKLRTLKNLRLIELRGNRISDIAPLNRMTKLNSLKLSDNNISDINFLSAMPDLKHLELDGNPVSDIKVFNKELKGIAYLKLGLTKVVDLSPLSELENIHTLDLSGISALDFSPLNNLDTIKHLDLSYTKVSDLSILVGLSNLTDLNLADSNGVTDLRPLIDLPSLRKLDVSGLSNIILESPQNLTDLWKLKLKKKEEVIGRMEIKKQRFLGEVEGSGLRTYIGNLDVSRDQIKLVRGKYLLDYGNTWSSVSVKDLRVQGIDLYVGRKMWLWSPVLNMQQLTINNIVIHGTGTGGDEYKSSPIFITIKFDNWDNKIIEQEFQYSDFALLSTDALPEQKWRFQSLDKEDREYLEDSLDFMPYLKKQLAKGYTENHFVKKINTLSESSFIYLHTYDPGGEGVTPNIIGNANGSYKNIELGSLDYNVAEPFFDLDGDGVPEFLMQYPDSVDAGLYKMLPKIEEVMGHSSGY